MTKVNEPATGVGESRAPEKRIISLWRWGLLIALILLFVNPFTGLF